MKNVIRTVGWSWHDDTRQPAASITQLAAGGAP